MANYKSPNLDVGEKEEGKKKLNPKRIHASLVAGYQANIKLLALIMIILEAIFLPLGIFIAGIDNYEPGWDVVIAFGFGIVPIVIFGSLIISVCRAMKKVVNGSYSLKLDTIERVVTDDRYVYRRKGRGYYEHAMYLWHCGRVVISLQDTYINSEGDKCYVLVFDDKPNEAIGVFNTKFYELEDVDGVEGIDDTEDTE